MTRRPRDTDLPTADDDPASASGGEGLDVFYRDLERLLLEQLKADARQHYVRLKLLEMYFETRRIDEFMKQALLLQSLQRDPRAVEWQKCVSMGMVLKPGDPMFSQAPRDTVEFVETRESATAPKGAPVRRFGDEARRARLFDQLAQDYESARSDPGFLEALDRELMAAARRPSSLLHAVRLSSELRGAQVYLKREDLSPADTHLTISVVGTGLLAKRLGRRTLVTGTTDGRRGVITAAVAARLGLEAVVFMDAEEIHRQSGNVFRLWLMGAKVESVDSRSLRNRDVREAALDFWGRNARDTLMVIGLDAAPQPYPMMAREFTAAIGRETKRQVLAATRRLPDVMVARGGNNADALGFFPPFLSAPDTRLICVEPLPPPARPAVPGDPWDPTKIPLTDKEQRVARTILEGLEYPGVTREHAWLKASGRVEYVTTGEDQAKSAIQRLSHREGIIPALETAHALATACHVAQTLRSDQSVILMMAEDASKDLWDIGRKLGVPF